jgi:threonine dehydrogenase-like Zn-dependent dehydrogenase
MSDPTWRECDPFGVGRKNTTKDQGGFSLWDLSLPLARDEALVEIEQIRWESTTFERRKLSQFLSTDLPQFAIAILRGHEAGPESPHASWVSQGERRWARLDIRGLARSGVEGRPMTPSGRRELWGERVFLPAAIRTFPMPEVQTSDPVLMALAEAAAVVPKILELSQDANRVLVFGAGGVSGVLALAAAHTRKAVKTIALDRSQAKAQRLSQCPWADEVIHGDATESAHVMELVWNATKGAMADLIIDLSCTPATEPALLRCLSPGGRALIWNTAVHLDWIRKEEIFLPHEVRVEFGSWNQSRLEETFSLVEGDSILREWIEAEASA